jgi:single-stranded-DNA-specific exonuclease
MQSYSIREAIPKTASDLLKAFPEHVRHLLYHRGIDTYEKAEAFLSPDYDLHGHDPFTLKDMDKAISRMYKAVKGGEKIIVFSDYDADGIPGGVIFHDFLKKIGCTNFENYIPHRHHEGFGLNLEAIDQFKEKGARLLITIDCGIADAEEVLHAQKLGIDVIVTDHHEVVDKIPQAFAIINPKQKDCLYSEKMLCGSGVIYKVVQAFLKKHGTEFNVNVGWEKWLLDMVGIATLSDMVPLTGENRTFAQYGLVVLRKTSRKGLVKLYEKLKLYPRNIVEDDIGFSISPRINAASRMGKPMDAFKLLSTQDESEADTLADHLEEINNERKGTVASLVKEVRKIIGERYSDDKKVIVIGNPDWRPSLLGLAANSFAEEYSCPVFLWGRDGDGLIKGSCRSGGGISVLSVMQNAVQDTFLQFGGHSASGGFELVQEKVHTLQEELDKSFVIVSKGEKREEKKIIADLELYLDSLTWRLFDDINQLSPFGTGNPKPVFVFQKISPVEVKAFGKEKNHLELIFKKNDGKNVSAIGFFMEAKDFEIPILVGRPITLIATLEKSTFKRTPELRLRIQDIVDII